MNKVILVEYQGRCDENGVPVGHAPKVIKEYYDFIKDFCDVTITAPQGFLNAVDFHTIVEPDTTCISDLTTFDLNESNLNIPSLNIANSDTLKKDCNSNNNLTQPPKNIIKYYFLPYHISMKGHTPFIEKITNKLHMFKNISKAIKLADNNNADILWFYNVEYYIMLYFAFCRKPKQKVYMTMFFDGYHKYKDASFKKNLINSVKQIIFEKAQKKFDLIIAAGESFKYRSCRSVFIPDYYYIPEIFDKRRNVEKSDMAVCLGTMGRRKQLREMVKAFNRIGYRLVIAGRFYDKELLDELRKTAADNIEVYDSYLSYDEYLDMLAKAKFSVLPYPEEMYSHQTSGVLQETIFVNTIPITYNSILKGNGINGIGFDSWDNLTAEMLAGYDKNITAEYENQVNTTYSKNNISKKYKDIF